MKIKLFLFVLALQSAWLLGTVFVRERALSQGAVIRLETKRVDPRDLLRGDYLILNYKLSNMPTNQFRSDITWASGQVIAVEACTDSANPTWLSLQTDTLANSSCYFSDPQWTNYPARFYRLRSP